MFLAVIILALVACVPQTPIPIYITPTHEDLPTDAGVAEDTTATIVASPATLLTVPPNATAIGPIVGPDYTLQPTETPRPTHTPDVSPTSVPPSLTPTPSGPSPTPSVSPTPSITPTPLPALDSSQIGIQVHTDISSPDWGSMLNMVDQLGVGWLKVQANWAWLQPNGPDDFGQNFGLFQINIQMAYNRGYKGLVSIAKAPDWARSNHNEDGPPDDPQVLINFINLLLSKVGDVIEGVEIWNEPNLIREWTGPYPMTGGGYMQLFRPAYDAVRAYSPSLMVVTAGLAPTGDSPWSIDDRTFLRQMYNAGLGAYRDVAIGVHPYGWGNPPDATCCDMSDVRGWDDDPHFFFANTLDEYRNIMVNNGHGDIPMWITELGWATWDRLDGEPPDPWIGYNSEWDQANYTIRALEIVQDRDYIGPLFLWNLNFANEITVGQRQEIAAYSIILPVNPRERPLFWVLSEAVRGGG